jgi:hypothetical protein
MLTSGGATPMVEASRILERRRCPGFGLRVIIRVTYGSDRGLETGWL